MWYNTIENYKNMRGIDMNFLYNRKKTAIIYNDIEYSYRDVINSAKYYSSLIPIEKDERVIIFTENRPEFIYAFFAIWDKEGIAVNIDGSYEVEQVAYVLKDSDPKYIFVSENNYETATKAKELSNSNVTIIKFEDIDVKSCFASEEAGIKQPEDDKVIVILYTSGTTGEPKGVMLTFSNIMSNMNAVREIEVITEKDRILGVLPFHHVLPLCTTILIPIYFGGLLVILKELSSDALRAALGKYKITVVIGVPRIWEMLHKGIMAKINASGVTKKIFKIAEKIGSETISKKIFKKVHEGFGGCINLFVSGGAKLDGNITRDFKTLGFKMLEGYGLTETSPIISFNRPNDIKAGTVGIVIPGVTVKIAEDGEILVTGANVMKGYYGKPEATAQAIDEEGWFHTGDLGYFDEGHLVISGRKKEMIVLSNGKNINPVEIEIELQRASAGVIKEVAVMEHNNHLMALIYPDFDMTRHMGIVNVKEDLKWKIIDGYNAAAPNYRKILETKIISKELPKTKLGKVQRFKLKDFLKEADTDSEKKEVSDYVETEEYIRLKSYLQKVHSDAVITPDSHLEIDIGMDSLDNVELIAYLEANYGVIISEEDLSKYKLVRELADFIKEQGKEFKESETDWKKIFSTPVEQKIPHGISFATFINFLILKPAFKFYAKLNKGGMEKIPDGPIIFAGNHQSMIDAFAFGQLLTYKQSKKTYYLGTSEQFMEPWKKWVANHSNIIIIDLNKNIKESLKVLAKVLKEGNNVVIFPEGARTRDGEIQDFKKSFAILSKELEVPVVVFGIDGAYNIMTPGSSEIKKGEFSVEILEVIEPKNLTVEEIVEETKQCVINYLKRDKK